jgi:hypothetical protein
MESNENVAILPILKSKKLSSLLNFECDIKFYFLHMKYDEVGTTLKHPEIINGNVKNLSKRNFYFKNLTLPLIASIFGQTL